MCRIVFIALVLAIATVAQSGKADQDQLPCGVVVSLENRATFEDERSILNALGALLIFRHPELQPALERDLVTVQLSVPTKPFSRDVVHAMQMALSGYYYLLHYRTTYHQYWAAATEAERIEKDRQVFWNERAEAHAPHGEHVEDWTEIAETILPQVAEKFMADESVPLIFRFGISEYLAFKKEHGIEKDHPLYRFYLHAVGQYWLAQHQLAEKD